MFTTTFISEGLQLIDKCIHNIDIYMYAGISVNKYSWIWLFHRLCIGHQCIDVLVCRKKHVVLGYSPNVFQDYSSDKSICVLTIYTVENSISKNILKSYLWNLPNDIAVTYMFIFTYRSCIKSV